MSKLIFTTQVYENYAWNEDGTIGTGDQAFWKAKGGSDYVIPNVDINDVQRIANRAIAQLDQRNDYFEEYVIAWEVVADDYLTQFERDQLEYDGKITFPAKELAL